MTASKPCSLSSSPRFHFAHQVDKAHSSGIFSKTVRQKMREGGQDLYLQRICPPGPDLSTALVKGKNNNGDDLQRKLWPQFCNILEAISTGKPQVFCVHFPCGEWLFTAIGRVSWPNSRAFRNRLGLAMPGWHRVLRFYRRRRRPSLTSCTWGGRLQMNGVIQPQGAFLYSHY